MRKWFIEKMKKYVWVTHLVTLLSILTMVAIILW